MSVSHHRSAGHSSVRTSKVRTRDTNVFGYWYFQEYGVEMPEDVRIAFRTGFNMGWKGRRKFDVHRMREEF